MKCEHSKIDDRQGAFGVVVAAGSAWCGVFEQGEPKGENVAWIAGYNRNQKR